MGPALDCLCRNYAEPHAVVVVLIVGHANGCLFEDHDSPSLPAALESFEAVRILISLIISVCNHLGDSHQCLLPFGQLP